MSKTEGSQTKSFCDECSASFLTQKGLETHFQRQHGNYCDACPIDLAVKKIKDVFRHNEYKIYLHSFFIPTKHLT